MTSESIEQISERLDTLGLKFDDWNRVVDISEAREYKVHHPAPTVASKLLLFAERSFEWCIERNVKEDWSLFHIDKLTLLPNEGDRLLIENLLSAGSSGLSDLTTARSAVFADRVAPDKTRDDRLDANLIASIYFMLLFEEHGWFVSSSASDGRRLGIQDGFMYFFSRNKNDISLAKQMLMEFEH